LKKAHLLRCARSPRSNVSVSTPPLVDFARASYLDLFEQPGITVFQQPANPSALGPMSCLIEGLLLQFSSCESRSR
jgi:hypothetical protein